MNISTVGIIKYQGRLPSFGYHFRLCIKTQERIEKHKEEIEELEALENTVDVPIPPNVIGTIVPPMDMPSVPQRPEGSIYYEQVFEKVVLNLATLAGIYL